MRRAGRCGEGVRPLLVFHSAPGSAGPLEALIQGLAAHREVIACDYLGNGDSDKAEGPVDIDLFARHGREIIDALGLATVDLFGTHTGAMIALEMAIRWPERVGRVVLEAPVLIDPAFAADILAHYLPPIVPDRWGTHLLKAWNMRRDMFLFWPWYRQAREAARSLGSPPLQTLHDWTVGLLKSGITYHLSYRSAFVYDTRARLPLLPRPAMICAGPADMLVEGLALAKQLAPAGTHVTAYPDNFTYPARPGMDPKMNLFGIFASHLTSAVGFTMTPESQSEQREAFPVEATVGGMLAYLLSWSIPCESQYSMLYEEIPERFRLEPPQSYPIVYSWEVYRQGYGFRLSTRTAYLGVTILLSHAVIAIAASLWQGMRGGVIRAWTTIPDYAILGSGSPSLVMAYPNACAGVAGTNVLAGLIQVAEKIPNSIPPGAPPQQPITPHLEIVAVNYSDKTITNPVDLANTKKKYGALQQ